MIIQSNIAQPQVIQRDRPIDTLLTRLAALAGAAGNIYQSYTTGRNAAGTRQQAMANLLANRELPTNELINALLALGAPKSLIEAVRAEGPFRISDRIRDEVLRRGVGDSKYWDNLYLQGVMPTVKNVTETAGKSFGTATQPPAPSLAPAPSAASPSIAPPVAAPIPPPVAPAAPAKAPAKGPVKKSGPSPVVSLPGTGGPMDLISRLSAANLGLASYPASPFNPPAESYYGIFPAV